MDWWVEFVTALLLLFCFSRQVGGDVGTVKHTFPKRLWNVGLTLLKGTNFEMQILDTFS